jgi:hypothetical protein
MMRVNFLFGLGCPRKWISAILQKFKKFKINFYFSRIMCAKSAVFHSILGNSEGKTTQNSVRSTDTT